jgi:hypothetical protein
MHKAEMNLSNKTELQRSIEEIRVTRRSSDLGGPTVNTKLQNCKTEPSLASPHRTGGVPVTKLGREDKYL